MRVCGRRRSLGVWRGIRVAGGVQRVVQVRVVRRVVRQQTAYLAAEDSADAADGRHVELVAHSVSQESLADLPGEDARVLLLQLFYVRHHLQPKATVIYVARRNVFQTKVQRDSFFNLENNYFNSPGQYV